MLRDPRPIVEDVLDDLTRLEDVLAVVVLRRDGLLIGARMPDGADPRRVAAMTAAIVGTSEIAAEVLSFGPFLRSIIDADEGRFLSAGAGPEVIISTLVNKDCNLGFVLLALERAGRKLMGMALALRHTRGMATPTGRSRTRGRKGWA